MILLLSLILVNGLGYLLRYYDLDRFIIILGFRFHLSLILPFVLFLFEKKFHLIKKQIKNINWREVINQLSMLLISTVLIFGSLILIKKADFSDPYFFYELGLSSLIDMPLYFIWNLPQLFMIGIVIHNERDKYKFSFPIIFLFLLLLFAYEFIPMNKEKLLPFNIYNYAAYVLFISLVFIQRKNLYASALTVFLFIWILVLLTGSTNISVIKNILAKNFDEWEGFLEFSKIIVNYISLGFSGLMIILFSIYFFVTRTRIKANE